jgi:hypothetical protein
VNRLVAANVQASQGTLELSDESIHGT